jgi:predicted enzyme related to lactoylglutathione lyase
MASLTHFYGDFQMAHPNMFILFVDNPAASATFYAKLFDLQPVEASPTFAMFKLPSGVMLGLWSRHTAEPAVAVTGGGAEVVIALADDAAVDAMHAQWQRQGLPILQAPVALDFGYTFVATDPDHHRLRVFTPHD